MARMLRYITQKVPSQPYTASACAVWCFDARFGRLARLFEDYQTALVDFVAVAGGAKGLIEEGPAREYILRQIEASLQLHRPGQIVLMVHEDCGAYGRHFDDQETTRNFYASELQQAAIVVREFLKVEGVQGVSIKKLYADFEGLWEVE